MGHGKVALDGGQSHALHELIGRVYKVTSDSMGSVSGVESATDSPVTIEKIKRDGKIIDVTSGLDLKKDDLILLVGKREAIVAHAESIGLEVAKDRDLNIVMKTLEVVVTKSDVRGTALSDLREKMADSIQHGIFILSASRSGSVFGDTDEVTLKEGDILKIYGSDADVDRAASYIGKPIIPSIMTDLCFTALGVVVGLLIGALTVKAGSVPLTLGSGGGALVSGLIFGWFKGRRPQFGGTIPTPALQFMKDIGLAGFVAIVGLDSGLQAFTTIKEQGVNILIAGLIVTFVPLLITMLLGKYVLRYKNSAIFGGALSGARSANPAFGQVLSLSGNAVPTVPFAITYALANVFLTLLGPLVVAFA
jgi:AspT/YidE/YbjL antiporter-like protein